LVRALLVLLALVFATPARGGIAAAQPQTSIQPQPASPKPGGGGPKPREGRPFDSAQGRPRKLSPAQSAAVERRLSEAVRRDPGSFQAHHALAGFYLQQGKLDAAIPHLEEARTIDPAHYANGYDLALALLETGSLDRARGEVQRMLRAKETAELHNLLGDVDERSGNLARAAAEYQRAAHMDPSEEHLFDWGNNLVQLRAFEPATDVFSAAIKRHPKSGRLYVGLGIAQYSRGQYEDAVRSFCQATDLAPSDPRPYLFLGDMYGVVPELGGEIARRLARFVKAQPRNALAHFHYAMTLWKGQPAGPLAADMRRVETLLRRAVALDPNLAKGFLELGILLSDEQRYKEAIQELRSAVRLEPGLAQAHYRLAQAYNRTGQSELAVKELEIFEQLKGGTR
jgi:tetratricopeptide (TPR) repeat protein